MLIAIQFLHFQTELHNPIHSALPLKILRHVLDSLDFLKITRWIYDLSQFYILLHQTYTQLSEQNEFHTITLKELYDRGEKHLNQPNNFEYYHRNNSYSSIIDKGIQSVNAYHSFTDGLIRPGACDQTQRFTKITRNTPIHYLVTTANYDEGDIVMRILSVLIDYHNSLLNSLEKETNENDNNIFGTLKTLVNKLTSKEVSILQIIHDNIGEFIQSLGDDNQLFEQIKQYEIKDFQLCYTDQIRQLYASSISDFQHLFADISQLLRAAIDYQLDEELSQNLTATIISIDDNKDIEKIKSIIQTITDLLNDLRSVEHFLLRQSNHSLTNTCEILDIKSSILDLIPHEIKCENYVAPEQENRFLNFLNEPSTSDTTPKNNTESDDDYDDIWKGIPSSIPNELIKDNLLDKQDFPQQCRNSTIQPTTSEEYLEYSSLFELNLKFVPLTLSTLFDQIHKQFEQAQA
ncbi:unnamed protein product [Rotaria magnacalcarata]|uniref:Uncharacterized protein n=2 Tax=Rotaria magnacalcarata TaxID=392030 RepID=A0A815W0C3_9BILA|nr:unnamed protein product [Rotaria magnacalcarata]